MIKKLFSFIFCMAPFGAVAAPTYLDPDANGTIAVTDATLNIDTDTSSVVVRNDPNNGTVAKNMNVGTNGIDIAGGMIVGHNTGADTGWIFILNETAAGTANGFTIASDGPIKIANMLQVEAGNYLKIGQSDGVSPTNMTVGSIDNLARLDLTNIGTFTSTGAIRNNTGATELDINAVSMTTGAIENTSGKMTIGHLDSNDNIIMTGGLNTGTAAITTSGAATETNIKAASVTSGNVQNNAGKMYIKTSGAVNSTGVIENKGGELLDITTGGAVTAGGAITNEGGTMIVRANSLTVTGTDASHNNASFVNSGDLTLDITGALTLANGFDNSAMQTTNEFYLAAGTLDVGGDENWLQLFSNKLNNFTVIVKNSDLTLNTNIINGQSDAVSNENANMTVTAKKISANSVTNSGKNLNITATGISAGDTITIANGITGNSGITTISGASDMQINGAVVSNSGATINILNKDSVKFGTTTSAASITNAGNMNISAATSPTGAVIVYGTVTNESGEMNINARTIDIKDTITTKGGTLSILGSDKNGGAVTLGAIRADGGTTNLNSLIGPMTVNGNLYTTAGVINIGDATTDLHVTGETKIAGDVTLSATQALPADAPGAVNIGGNGTQNFVLTSDGGMTIGGNIAAVQSDVSRTAQFIAGNNVITVDGDADAAGLGHLIFGNNENSATTIKGDVTTAKDLANNAGSIEFYGNEVKVGSLSGNGQYITHGQQITATDSIHIDDTIWFNNPSTDPATGLIVKDTDTFTLTTQPDGKSIFVGGIEMSSGKTLNILSAKHAIVDGGITANGELNITAAEIATLGGDAAVTNTGALNIDAPYIDMMDLNNSGTAKLVATNIDAGAINANAGTTTIIGDRLTATGLLTVLSGATATIDVANTNIGGPVSVYGDMTQGAQSAGLNITKSGRFTGESLNVTGDFKAQGESVDYVFTGAARIAGNVTVTSGADADIAAGGKLTTTNVVNSGTLRLAGGTGIDANNIMSGGDITLDSGTGITNVADAMFNGTTTLAGAGLTTSGALSQNMLRQNYTGAVYARDINVMSNNYTITTSSATFAGVAQESGRLTLRTSDLTVGGNIDATDLTVAATPATNWLNVGVTGNVSGGVKFTGLEHMKITGNYTYDSNSGLNMAILPYAAGGGMNSTIYDYWANVSLADDKTLGQIIHNPSKHPNPEPLISVNGTFITNLGDNINNDTGLLNDGQMGVQIFDMIDQGTAIWLLHADGGIREEGTKIRNVAVKFCNADGSKCFDYFKPTQSLNETGTDLPAYISVRDYNSDGTADSLYLVFDPRFGGPVQVFKIQPIVERENDHTKGEYTTAGALDDLIAGGLADAKFYNRTPIEAIPVAFAGTNMEEMSKELLNRMEYYNTTRDGRGLARFSRLFQPREIEQMAGSVVLNEHTSFRDFEDHMLDEFIWNRNRHLRKAWGEFDFGMARQKVDDGKRVASDRFGFTGGYDWQETETLILGLAGRVSHMSGDNDDAMDLGYLPGQYIAGSVNTTVSDTNFGLGAYMMQNLGTKMRLYGNAFLDLHWLDVTRDQTYMSKIDGDGTAFSLISEWGLMHDWLNQYIVGNVYARVGYNFGFSVKEKAAGDDYMKLKSDGYMILTPGYTLTAQKRIYPSAWFQLRPYAAIGVEYDVLGAPDNAKYKFAAAKHFTKYDIDIDPLWANIGGGMEFLSVTGVQVGLDYRYQYNADIQMHKIKLSGSYRF